MTTTTYDTLAEIKEPNYDLNNQISLDNYLSDPNLDDLNEIKYAIKDILSLSLGKNINIKHHFQMVKNKYFHMTMDTSTSNLILKVLDEYGDFFSELEDTLKAILMDSKIDSKDIPSILVLLEKLYSFIYNHKDKKINTDKAAEICGFFIKITIYLLIEKKKLAIEDDKTDGFLEDMEKLITCCVSLIKVTSVLKPKKCRTFLKTFFN
jgi:hypothetical protein